jgi:hypothetical protein
MMKKLAVPYVTETDRTPAVMKLLAWSEGLLEIIHRVQEENGHLRDEVAVLKGEKKRPTFKPSRMNEEAGKAAEPDRMQNGKPAKRRGSEKARRRSWRSIVTKSSNRQRRSRPVLDSRAIAISWSRTW